MRVLRTLMSAGLILIFMVMLSPPSYAGDPNHIILDSVQNVHNSATVEFYLDEELVGKIQNGRVVYAKPVPQSERNRIKVDVKNARLIDAKINFLLTFYDENEGEKVFVTTSYNQNPSDWTETTHFNPGQKLNRAYKNGDSINLGYAIHNISNINSPKTTYAIIPFNYGSDKKNWLKEFVLPSIDVGSKYLGNHMFNIDLDKYPDAIRNIDGRRYFSLVVRADPDRQVDKSAELSSNYFINIPIQSEAIIELRTANVNQKLLGRAGNYSPTTVRVNFDIIRHDDGKDSIPVTITLTGKEGAKTFNLIVPPKGTTLSARPFYLVWGSSPFTTYVDANIKLNDGSETNVRATVRFYGEGMPVPTTWEGGEDNPAGITG